jgi:hypothetical protein
VSDGKLIYLKFINTIWSSSIVLVNNKLNWIIESFTSVPTSKSHTEYLEGFGFRNTSADTQYIMGMRVGHHERCVINRRFSFQPLPVFIRRRQVQTYLHRASLSQSCLRKVWSIPVCKVNRLYEYELSTSLLAKYKSVQLVRSMRDAGNLFDFILIAETEGQ